MAGPPSLWLTLSGSSVSDSEIVGKVRRLAASGRLSHAYLITGPDGSGKHRWAMALASALVCPERGNPCGHCPHCKKAAAGIHPDVTVLRPAEGKKEILVSQVRQMRADVYIRPNEAGRKVCLIDPASAMNLSAQNALLKILEEGPVYAAFLLLSETAGALLPTIRSRCEEIALLPPEREQREEDPQAAALADLLLFGQEQALMARCVELENLDRDTLQALFQAALLHIEGRMRRDASLRPVGMKKIQLLKTLAEAALSHVGVGHLAGWLCAGNFSTG